MCIFVAKLQKILETTRLLEERSCFSLNLWRVSEWFEEYLRFFFDW